MYIRRTVVSNMLTFMCHVQRLTMHINTPIQHPTIPPRSWSLTCHWFDPIWYLKCWQSENHDCQWCLWSLIVISEHLHSSTTPLSKMSYSLDMGKMMVEWRWKEKVEVEYWTAHPVDCAPPDHVKGAPTHCIILRVQICCIWLWILGEANDIVSKSSR